MIAICHLIDNNVFILYLFDFILKEGEKERRTEYKRLQTVILYYEIRQLNI